MLKARAVSPPPAASPTLLQPRSPSSAPTFPLLTALSSTSTPHSFVSLSRVLTWLFFSLLVLSMVLYTAYQMHQMTLADSLDPSLSYRRLNTQFVPSSALTSLQAHSQPVPATPPSTPTPQHAATATNTTTTTTTLSPHLYTPTFAILILGDSNAATRYAQHWTSIACYAHRHNYTFLTHPNSATDAPHPCAGIGNFFFRKHCTVAQLMLAQPHVDWWLVLDGDVFVVDAELPLQRWLSSPMADPRVAGEYVVYHYERFHNGEIMAGNYIVGNCQRAIDYLMGWSDWHRHIPDHGFHNHDNGALHMHLLSYIVGPTSSDYQHVLSMYKAAASWAEYDAYVGAFRCVIGRRRLWPHLGLRIFRRGHFLVRDFFVSSEGDRIADITNIGVLGGGEVMFHGWKDDIVGVWWAEPVDGERCKAEVGWTPRLVEAVRVDMAELLRVVRERERYTVGDRGNAVAMQDVSDCFPQCPAEQTVAQEEIVRQRLCPAEMKERYVKAQVNSAAAGAG